MPLVERELAGDERRAAAIAVLDDLHQVPPLVRIEPVRAPVVEDQQIGFHQRAEETREATIAVGEFQLGEEPRDARVVDGVAVAAGFLRQRARQPGLADAARPRDEQIAMLGDPAAGGELLEEGFVEPPWRAVVDVLDRRLAVTQLGAAQPALEPPGVAGGRLAVEQQRQPFGVIEVLGAVLGLQLGERVGHAVELQGSELVDRGMRQHCVSSPQWK